MAVIWGLPNWVWLVIAGIALLVLVAIARALAIVFASLHELIDSLELSQQLLSASLESTRDEMEKMQEGLTRIGNRTPAQADAAWKDW